MRSLAFAFLFGLLFLNSCKKASNPEPKYNYFLKIQSSEGNFSYYRGANEWESARDSISFSGNYAMPGAYIFFTVRDKYPKLEFCLSSAKLSGVGSYTLDHSGDFMYFTTDDISDHTATQTDDSGDTNLNLKITNISIEAMEGSFEGRILLRNGLDKKLINVSGSFRSHIQSPPLPVDPV
ncbi:hypothetical protein GS399_06385 [Pedobacter sp. HMF7647]|uniref:DUF4251 domain-containing protein n=1 Tax=Hufsiella arboris TaxID=2695275 RepID=A0A7K1Y7N5_9SPHI|nr:hypothetical protein [Hufsiella arboris]MXV50594.1 hypothetical protein [Hufsiella arboris]